MSIRTLKTLLAIEREGTFVAAASALGLTQSAVSLQMRTLETELRLTLFERGRGRPVLNPQGRAIAARAAQIVRLHEDLASVAAPGGEIGGTLVLGAIPTVLTGVLPQALASLRASQPRMQVRVTAGLSAELTRKVADGELDAALVTQPIGALPGGLSWTGFAAEPLIVIAPPGAAGETDREILETHPFIRFQRRAWAGRLIDAELRRRRIEVQDAMELDALEAITSMVSHGLGAAIVPQRIGSGPLDPGLRAVPFGEPPLYREVGLVEPEANPRATLTRTLLACLMRLCEPACPAMLDEP
jgi:DNA-binding transcriptional LysR family regulator